MDENVTIWERRLGMMGVVCVGYTDHADAVCAFS
jgi:hypothetical protein